MMSIGRDGLFKGILMCTCESVQALRCCIHLRIFISRFEITSLHPYETAEALCRGRNKDSTAAEWQVVWVESRWYGPSMISNGRDGLFKSILRIVMCFDMVSCKKLRNLTCFLQENYQTWHVFCKETVIYDMFPCKKQVDFSNIHPYESAKALCRRYYFVLPLSGLKYCTCPPGWVEQQLGMYNTWLPAFFICFLFVEVRGRCRCRCNCKFRVKL